ncbi:MAG: MFS transporter, partial [Lachnospiraceae bacterium]|nr:MFS transporter [Lachnospiraceae bacterium]
FVFHNPIGAFRRKANYKHHKNIQPFLMSMLSMVIKIGVALSSIVVGWGLVAVGFDAENVTEAAKAGIMNLTTVLPMIVLIVGAVVTFLNPLNDKKVEEIHTELAKRHAAEAGR